MTGIVFVGTSVAEFPDSVGASETTLAAFRRGDYVDRSVYFHSQLAMVGRLRHRLTASLTDFWFRGIFRSSGAGSAVANNVAWMEFLDLAGNHVATVRRTNVSTIVVAHGDADTTVTVDLAFAGTNPIAITAHVEVAASGVTISLYNEGTPVATATAATAVQKDGVREFSIGHPFYFHTSSLTTAWAWSEIMVSDGVDLRGLRLGRGTLSTTAGTHNDTDGARADMVDGDLMTGGVFSGPANERFSSEATFGSEITDAVIRSVHVTASMTVDGEPVADRLDGSLRIGSTDYDAGQPDQQKPVGSVSFEFAQNPATSVAWTGAALSGLEAGVKTVIAA